MVRVIKRDRKKWIKLLVVEIVSVRDLLDCWTTTGTTSGNNFLFLIVAPLFRVGNEQEEKCRIECEVTYYTGKTD